MTNSAPRWTRKDDPRTLTVPVIGRIEGCTHPESAELLPDGEHIVFGNCAMTVGVPFYREGKGLVYLEGEAFISLARLGADRSVGLVRKELVTGLTGTLGCDVLTKGTDLFPAGTVFMASGGNPFMRRGDSALGAATDRHRPCALGFDPLTGEIRGRIPLWAGTAVAEEFNPLDQPNGLAINAAGDLFVGDIPNGNPAAPLPPPSPSAVYRIPHHALDALTRGEAGAAADVRRVLAPGFVNGLTVSRRDGECWMVSCSTHDVDEGGLYRLTDADFARGELPEASVKGIGVIDGVGFTRRGALVLTNPRNATVHLFTPDGEHVLLEGEGVVLGRNPADVNICYPACLGGDEPALLVPDVCVGPDSERSAITILDLSGY
ncbi:MAG TPA: hypothetical protein VMG08_19495 [Allosphingosinicella sp.]|nr:hypothetical protein [Allosphingosinicella sp.]